MSKTPKRAVKDDDNMRPEYDFSNGIRGKYTNRFPPRHRHGYSGA